MGTKNSTSEGSHGARGAEPQDGDRAQSDGAITADDVRAIVNDALKGFATGPLNKALSDHRTRVERTLDERLGSASPSSSDSDGQGSGSSRKKSGETASDESLETRQLRQRLDELEKRDKDREAELQRRERDDKLRKVVDGLQASDPKELFRRLKGDDAIKVDEDSNEYFFEVDGKVHTAADFAGALVKSSSVWAPTNSKEGGGPTPGATKSAGGLSSEELGKLPANAALSQIYGKGLQNKG